MDSDFWTSRLAAAKRQYNLLHHQRSSHLDRLNIDDFEVEDEVRLDFPCPYCYEDFDIASLCSHFEDEHSCESKATWNAGNSPCQVCYVACRGISVAAACFAIRKSCTCFCFKAFLFCQLTKLGIEFIATIKPGQLVCPICAVKVARDMLSHITLQHGHLFKMQRRRKLRRVAIPNSQALSLLGRDLHEAHLQVLLGGGGYRSSNNANVSNAATDPFLSSLIPNFPTSEAEEISKSMVATVEDTPAKNTAQTYMWRSSFDPSLSREEREKRMRQAMGRAGFVQDLLLSTLLSD